MVARCSVVRRITLIGGSIRRGGERRVWPRGLGPALRKRRRADRTSTWWSCARALHVLVCDRTQDEDDRRPSEHCHTPKITNATTLPICRRPQVLPKRLYTTTRPIVEVGPIDSTAGQPYTCSSAVPEGNRTCGPGTRPASACGHSYGDGVNIAARLEGIAEPGGTSSPVRPSNTLGTRSRPISKISATKP
jgi:hypothetical protein